MKKIAMVMPSLQGGGAERVVSHLLQLWEDREDLEFHLILIYPVTGQEYEIPSHVKVHRLNVNRVLGSFRMLLRLLNDLSPASIYSSMANVNMLLLAMRPFLKRSPRLMIRENSLISKNLNYDNFQFLRKLGYRFLYPKADVIVCQSKAIFDDMIDSFPKLEDKAKVISNPCLVESARLDESPFEGRGRGPHLLMVGRLSREKRVMHALESFAHWLKSYPEAELHLLGDGPDRDMLEANVRTRGLGERVHFWGFRKNVTPYIFHADVFLLCSEYEGYPNSLLEALNFGTSVLVEKHPGGTQEMMQEFKRSDAYVDSLEKVDLKLYLERGRHFSNEETLKRAEKQAYLFLENLLEEGR